MVQALHASPKPVSGPQITPRNFSGNSGSADSSPDIASPALPADLSQRGLAPSPSLADDASSHQPETAKVSPPPADFIRQALSPRQGGSPSSAHASDPGSSHLKAQWLQQSTKWQPRSDHGVGKAGRLQASRPAGGHESDADDDMCRMSSVQDTPASSVATSRPSKGRRHAPAKSVSSHGGLAAALPTCKSPLAAVEGHVAANGPDHGTPTAGSSTSPPLPKPR